MWLILHRTYDLITVSINIDSAVEITSTDDVLHQSTQYFKGTPADYSQPNVVSILNIIFLNIL